MSPAVSIVLGALALFVFGFAVGCPLLFGLFRFPLQRNATAGIVLAAPVGVLAYGFVAYVVSSCLGLGLGETCRPAFAAMALGVGLFFFLAKTTRAEIREALRQAAVPVLAMLILAPLSFAFVLLPLVRNGWEMAYSIGNDGARYLMMIEYLQHDFWRYGKAATETLRYPLGNRPVMHYLSALPTALSGVTPYVSYSMSTALASLTMAAATLGTGFLSFRVRPALGIISVTAVFLAFGLFGSFQTLYYTAFIGQYYSILPALAALATFSMADTDWRRFAAWCLFVMLMNATVYSVGNLIIIVLMLSGGFLALSGQLGLRRTLACIAIVLAAAGTVTAVFNYELGEMGHFLDVRNAGYDYGALNSLLIMTGTVSKYSGYREFSTFQKAVLVFPIIALVVNIAYQGIRQGPMRALLGACTALGLVYVCLYVAGKYYLLNKTSAFFLPLLLVGVPCALAWLDLDSVPKSICARLVSLVVLAAVSLCAAKGYVMLAEFYEPIATSRGTYISEQMDQAKKAMLLRTGSKRIVSSDMGLERTLLMRQLFSGFAWQPLYAPEVWDEYGIRRDNPPGEFSAYQYDYVLAGLDVIEPVDYAEVNQDHLLYDFGGQVFIYDGNASIVEFGPEWKRGEYALFGQESKKRSRRDVRVENNRGMFLFINRDKSSTMEIVVHATGGPVNFTVNGHNVTAMELGPEGTGTRFRLHGPGAFASGVNKVIVTAGKPGLSVSEVKF